MTRRRLVLLRHGRTAWNADRRGQGHLDVPLDDTGHEQAVRAAIALAAYEPATLWSSDLARARHTAAYVGKECGLEPVLDARLREYDLGERTGLTLAEFAGRYPEEHAEFRAGRFRAVPGGETPEDVRTRMLAGLDDVLAGIGPEGTAVVVGHGGALRVAVSALVGHPQVDGGWLRGLGNCAWAVAEELGEPGSFRLAAYDVRG